MSTGVCQTCGAMVEGWMLAQHEAAHHRRPPKAPRPKRQEPLFPLTPAAIERERLQDEWETYLRDGNEP